MTPSDVKTTYERLDQDLLLFVVGNSQLTIPHILCRMSDGSGYGWTQSNVVAVMEKSSPANTTHLGSNLEVSISYGVFER